jgi:hypothetical protein
MDIAIGEIIIFLIAILLLFVYLYNEKKVTNVANHEENKEENKETIPPSDE